MNTFLPYPSFEKSARTLDYKRLGNQRREAILILNCLEGKSQGWRHHPAVKMWAGYKSALKAYFNLISLEWIKRGFKHRMGLFPLIKFDCYPSWLNTEFCLSHQSNLIRKFPEHYRPIFGGDIPDNLPYIWPVK